MDDKHYSYPSDSHKLSNINPQSTINGGVRAKKILARLTQVLKTHRWKVLVPLPQTAVIFFSERFLWSLYTNPLLKWTETYNWHHTILPKWWWVKTTCTFLKPYRLHWYTCGIFSSVMYILWYFHTECLASLLCTGAEWSSRGRPCCHWLHWMFSTLKLLVQLEAAVPSLLVTVPPECLHLY